MNDGSSSARTRRWGRNEAPLAKAPTIMPNIRHALNTRRDDDFAAWYQDVISSAEMAEESGVRGREAHWIARGFPEGRSAGRRGRLDELARGRLTMK